MKFKKYYRYVITVCAILLIFILIILFKSNLLDFKSNKKTPASSNGDINIALIINNDSDSEDIDALIQSLKLCSSSFEKKYASFKVQDYNNSYEDTIIDAMKRGATLVVCPDSSFEETIYKMQNLYKGIYFLIVDGIPHNADNSDSTLNFNVISLTFDDAEAGFLAGYAAVYEGYARLSFIGLENDIQSIHYCYGFLQGADYAAKDTGVNEIHIKTAYASTDTCEDIADKMYADGSEIIIACNKKIIDNVISSAKSHDKKIITCDDNSPEENKYIIANTTKNYYIPATDCITKFYQGSLRGVTIKEYNSTDNAIALAFKTSDFVRFDSKIYDSIYYKLSDSELQIISDTTVSPEELGLTNIILD